MILEEIKDIKIKDIDSDRLKRWITDEIYTLADDYGQKLDPEQGRHMANRILGLMNSSKIQNWYPATIHGIFQMGLTGAYGKASKVTFYLINSWIWAHDRNTRTENKSNGIDIPDYHNNDEYYKRKSVEWIPFIRFCQDRCIAVHELTEEQHLELKERFYKKGPQSIEIDNSIPRYSLNGTKVNL